MPFSPELFPTSAGAEAGSDPAATACALDRAADAWLFLGRANTAEWLSIRAAELREDAR